MNPNPFASLNHFTVPLRRLGAPEDIARAAVYLVESDFVTGEVLTVDGGQRLL